MICAVSEDPYTSVKPDDAEEIMLKIGSLLPESGSQDPQRKFMIINDTWRIYRHAI